MSRFIDTFGSESLAETDPKVVCIGSITAAEANKFGFDHVLVPDEFTTSAMVAKLVENI